MDNSLFAMVKRMLRDEIKKSGIGPSAFSKKVRISRQTLYKFLNDNDENTVFKPRAELMDLILELLGYTYTTLEDKYRIEKPVGTQDKE